MSTPTIIEPGLYNIRKETFHFFGTASEFTIGRNTDCSLDILSKFISRNQCSITRTNENEFFIKDLSSFHTTRVNDKEVRNGGQKLYNADEISFLYYSDSVFQFFEVLDSTRSVLPLPKRKIPNDASDIDQNDVEEPHPKKSRMHIESNELETVKANLECSLSDRERLEKENKDLKEKLLNIEKQQKYFEEKFLQNNLILEETQKSLETFEIEKTDLSLKLVEQNNINEQVIMELQEKIEQLKECESELERVIIEKDSIEKQLIIDQDTTDQLPDAKLTTSFPPMPQFHLFHAVNMVETKKNLEKYKEELIDKEYRLNKVVAEKELFFTTLSDLFEQEFTCSVCSEILFQATSLTCRHTFCAKCVVTWKLNKKECPICRTKIKAEVMPLVFDTFLDKACDLLGGDFKKRRDEVRDERTSNRAPGAGISPFRAASNPRPARARRGRASNSRNLVIPNPTREFQSFMNSLGQIEPHLVIDLVSSPYPNRRR